MPPVPEARITEPRRLDQGANRRRDDRGGRARRPAGAGRHRGRGHGRQHQERAGALAATIPGVWFADQFNHPANPLAHETGTALAIWAQMRYDVDAIVAGVGSSGPITGLTRFFRRVQPALDFVPADPEGSVLAAYARSDVLGTAGSWAVEGIGEDFVPGIADLDGVRAACSIPDAASTAERT